MSTRNSALMTLMSIISLVAGCSSPLGEHEAKRLAQRSIEEYAKAEMLASSAFGAPNISSEPGHEWVFDYSSNTSPRHLVRIYVDASGKVEVNRLVDVRQ